MSAIGKDSKLWLAYRYVMGRLDRLRGHFAGQAPRVSITTRLHDSLLRRLTSGRPPIGLPVIFMAVVLTATAWLGSGQLL